VVRKLFIVGVAAGTLVGLAACTSSSQVTGASGISTVPPSTTSAPSSQTSSPQPTVTNSGTATPTATPTATTAEPKACTVPDVSVKASTGQGAAGTQVQRFIVTNTSPTTCTMRSYPFISPFGLQAQGKSKVEANFDDIKVGPIPSDFGDLGSAGGLRTLGHGGTAVFFLKWSDVTVGNSACDNANGFDFKPPQDTSINDNKLVGFTFMVCGGSVQVSQMLSSSVGS
jgi:uncharacterized protein DUF4232